MVKYGGASGESSMAKATSIPANCILVVLTNSDTSLATWAVGWPRAQRPPSIPEHPNFSLLRFAQKVRELRQVTPVTPSGTRVSVGTVAPTEVHKCVRELRFSFVTHSLPPWVGL
ncbi:hypothetical protein MPTK1_5g02570 [Marchantia polymorpha subsp. ruderalis]|uniref:Uncharacterized protein n=2 Tax=Marchantia polymorpha TaxID=3197 RepID=A0AAF6BE84_MARPO|nr:hypothetical protein MARPO_0124s0066 [Marchantia polymorpha]BBN10318.1 hypothetical protein Mp_5g02570 [Marchantia polymorpha subsp. ruderalis]|eukprot:PTQ30499.1 hypothetical protein MARPO_0124s0066 [Marchantia polymorpha]